MPGRLRLRSTLRGNRLRYAAAAMLLLAQALALTFVGTQDTSASKARSIMHSAATMTVAVLKERLREKGLSTSGLKAVLVKRFEDAEAKEGGYARLTVSQLKVKCGALGLSKSGRKADLVARLEAAASQEVEPESTVAGFRVGDKVMALFEGDEEEAMIQCHNGDETYLISRQEDGFEHTQKAESMRLLVRTEKEFRYSAGDKVQALAEGVWYPARVKCINDSGSYTVRWEDGTESETEEEALQPLPIPVALSELRPRQKLSGTVGRTFSFGTFVNIGAEREGLLKPWFTYEGEEPSFKAGDKVQALYEEDDEYYDATIQKDRGDETYDLLWDEDGEEHVAKKVHLKLLRRGELEEGSKVDVMVESVMTDKDGQRKLFLATVEAKIGTKPRRKVDLSVFEGLQDEWLPGQVTRILPFGAFVKVTSPKGGEAQGLLHLREIRDGFIENLEDELALGSDVQVRLKYLNSEEGVMQLSMK